MTKGREPVLILHHAIPEPGSCHNAESDAGVMDEVRMVERSLQALHIPYRTASVSSLAALPSILGAAAERIVFNLVENFPGAAEDAMQVPAICRAHGKECTGNESSNQTLALDKWRTKAILHAAGLPVPAGLIVPVGSRAIDAPRRRGQTTPVLPPPPWIVKPLFADASEGIHPSSVIRGNSAALHRAISRIHRDFGHPALVEQFFGSREINIALFQQGQSLKVLPIAEIEFRNFGRTRPRIVDYAAKWHAHSFEYRNTVRVVPAVLEKDCANQLRHAARVAWHTLGCRDYARVDFRLDENGNHVILEVNPNPDISPDSGFEAALKAAGIPYHAFVKALYMNARTRLGKADRAPRPSPARSPVLKGRAHPSIRRTLPSDRDAILAFLRGTGYFHDGEIEVAREVLDEALAKGPSGHYQSFTLGVKGRPVGWICYGPTPCTVGTFDIYWIGVKADAQGKGYGRALLDHAEKEIRRKEGRLVVIETSGRPLYDATRGFYIKTGYRETARIPDFYASGDARVIYSKALERS